MDIQWFFCSFSAFIMFFIGCTSVYLMMAISFERYIVLYKPVNTRNHDVRRNIIIVIISSLIGLTWASLPLVGWSHYELEGARTSCSVAWKEKSMNMTSFKITLLTTVYFIPLITIVFTNARLIVLVRLIFPKFLLFLISIFL